MIVGVHGLADETLRLQEYSPVFDAERFAAHERFFVGDVGRWARSRFGVALPAGRTAVFGVSAGGKLALALGLRHPDVYGAVLSGSPGAGYQPPGVLPDRIARTYLVAGTLEPFFLSNSQVLTLAISARPPLLVSPTGTGSAAEAQLPPIHLPNSCHSWRHGRDG
jgi:pimeloyl-ACP methyl ester carboxylesterase